MYTLETIVTDDLYYDDTTHILGSVFRVFSYTLGCMRRLVYMCFILAMFPLKYGFIIVQYSIHANCIVYSILHPLNVRFLSLHQSAETQCWKYRCVQPYVSTFITEDALCMLKSATVL